MCENAYLRHINSFSPTIDYKFNCISLFSGGGGLDLGAHFAGFKSLLVSDLISTYTQTIKHNLPHVSVYNEDAMAHYINFYFKNLIYDDDYYLGSFTSPDDKVFCEFEYNRHTKEIRIWNNSRSVEEIMPIPIWWLDRKLERNGLLRSSESKISY